MPKSVLITRPEPQCSELAKRLSSHCRTLCFPTMEMQPIPLTNLSRTDLSTLTGIIYVSQHAVLHSPILNSTTHIPHYAIGKATQRALELSGISTVSMPLKSDSEHLLKLIDLKKPNQHFMIVKGEGGRQLIQQTLKKHQIKVTEISVYKRVRTKTLSGELIPNWQSFHINIVVITSESGLQYLIEMLGEFYYEKLEHCTFVVVSERLRRCCQSLLHSPKSILVSEQPDNESIAQLIEKLEHY